MKKSYFDVDDLFGDDDFTQDFCRGCAGLVHYPATLEEPEEWDCKRGGDPHCRDCLRHNAFRKIVELVDKLNGDIQDEVDDPDPGYFEMDKYFEWYDGRPARLEAKRAEMAEAI